MYFLCPHIQSKTTCNLLCGSLHSTVIQTQKFSAPVSVNRKILTPFVSASDEDSLEGCLCFTTILFIIYMARSMLRLQHAMLKTMFQAGCLCSFHNPMQVISWTFYEAHFVLKEILCWPRLCNYPTTRVHCTYIVQDSKIYKAPKASSAFM